MRKTVCLQWGTPHTFTTVVKNLGITFGNMNLEKVNDATIMKSTKVKKNTFNRQEAKPAVLDEEGGAKKAKNSDEDDSKQKALYQRGCARPSIIVIFSKQCYV